MGVVVGRTRFAQILEHPKLVRARFHIPLRLDARQLAEELELDIWPGTATVKHRLIELWLGRPNALQMSVHYPIHRSLKLLASLHAPIVEPAVPRFAPLAVRRFPSPGYVPPKNGLVKFRGPKDRPRVNAIIEKHDECGTPIMANGEWLPPASRSW